MGKRNKRKQNTLTKHHVVPSSRGGSSKLENIAKIKDLDHRNYHALFANKVPEEIVEYLVKHYWKGDWSYVERAYENHNI